MCNYIICLVVSSSERAEVKKKKRYKPECGQNGVEFFFLFPTDCLIWVKCTNKPQYSHVSFVTKYFSSFTFSTTCIYDKPNVFIHSDNPLWTNWLSIARSFVKANNLIFFVQPSINYLLSIPERPWFPISLLYQKIQKKFFFCKMNK